MRKTRAHFSATDSVDKTPPLVYSADLQSAGDKMAEQTFTKGRGHLHSDSPDGACAAISFRGSSFRFAGQRAD
jgi:hypothetical protein